MRNIFWINNTNLFDTPNRFFQPRPVSTHHQNAHTEPKKFKFFKIASALQLFSKHFYPLVPVTLSWKSYEINLFAKNKQVTNPKHTIGSNILIGYSCFELSQNHFANACPLSRCITVKHITPIPFMFLQRKMDREIFSAHFHITLPYYSSYQPYISHKCI